MIARFFKRPATAALILASALLVPLLAKIAANVEGPHQAVDAVLEAPLRDLGEPTDLESLGRGNGLHVDQVEFADGSTAQVTWRTVPVPSMKFSPPFVEHYPGLREEAARGEPEAAYALYRMLESCQFAYEGEAELERALHELKSTHKLQAPEMDEPVLLRKTESVRGWEVMLKESYEVCAGISQGQKAERREWLEIAANAAYPLAMREYSSTITDYEAGVSLDLARWHEGDAYALRSLAKRYWANYNDGHKPTDNVAGYAAMHAFVTLARENANLFVHTHDRRFETFEAELADFRRALRQYEINAAESQAAQLIKSNSNCCY